MKRVCVVLALLTAAPARGDAPRPAEVKAAVEKGLRRIQQGAASYPKHRNCFSCHHQAMSMFSLDSAARRGLAIDADRRADLVGFTLRSFAKKETIAKGQGIGGANTTAGYALAAVSYALTGMAYARWETGRVLAIQSTGALASVLIGVIGVYLNGLQGAAIAVPLAFGSQLLVTLMLLRPAAREVLRA